MAKHMPTEDFRAVRWILEPDDFAGGDDGPEVPPRDLIDLKTWRSIVTLPDDVAIRTSNHGGSWLKILDEWHSDLTYIGISVADKLDLSDTPLGSAIFNCHDDYHAGLFDALTGFYRTAHSCLRNCLEYLTVGLYFELTGDMGRFRDWEAGNEEIMFGKAADLLGRVPAVLALETHLMGTTGDNLLRPRNSATGDLGGLLRRAYRDLSAYVHGTPGSTEIDIRRSNGPILVGAAFDSFTRHSALVMAYVCICAQLARPGVSLVATADIALANIFHQARGSIGSNHSDWGKLLDAVPVLMWP